jgi:hypothetical protein
MSLNLFKAEQALLLNKLRFLCFARCAANGKSVANRPAHMGASSDANLVVNSNATPSASFAANHSATLMLRCV